MTYVISWDAEGFTTGVTVFAGGPAKAYVRKMGRQGVRRIVLGGGPKCHPVHIEVDTGADFPLVRVQTPGGYKTLYPVSKHEDTTR